MGRPLGLEIGIGISGGKSGALPRK